MPVQHNITPDLQIRKLPYKVLRELSEILDIPGPRNWQSLIGELDIEYTRGQVRFPIIPIKCYHYAVKPNS